MSRDNRTDVHRRNAQGYFHESQKRDDALKAELRKARDAEKDKIARLRALRLAREGGEGSGSAD